MKDIVDTIVENPANGLRLSDENQTAVAAFVRALGFGRDLDTAVGVALGLVIMINARRGIPSFTTIDHVRSVASRVQREWQPHVVSA